MKKKRNYKLTKDYIKSILLKQHFKDYYTGLVPKDYHQYSIDRIDSDKDYEEGNVVITTVTINTMKGHQKIEEFYSNIELLYNKLIKNKYYEEIYKT